MGAQRGAGARAAAVLGGARRDRRPLPLLHRGAAHAASRRPFLTGRGDDARRRPGRVARRGRRRLEGARAPTHQRAAALPRGRRRARRDRAQQGRRHGAAAARRARGLCGDRHRLDRGPAGGRRLPPRSGGRPAHADAGRRGVPGRRGHHAGRLHPPHRRRERRAPLISARRRRLRADLPEAARVSRRGDVGPHRRRNVRYRTGGAGGGAGGRSRTHPRDRLVPGLDRHRAAAGRRRRGHRLGRRSGRDRAGRGARQR